MSKSVEEAINNLISGGLANPLQQDVLFQAFINGEVSLEEIMREVGLTYDDLEGL